MKMSKTKQILELTSPSMNTMRERIMGLPQQCNYCCGNGWFWGRDELGEAEKIPCPMCGGCRQLQPEITVEWKGVELFTNH